MNRNGVFTISLTLLLIATASIAINAESIPDGERRQIRTTDARLRMLLTQGMRTSPTLRALVERLQASDVVVYLRCEGTQPRAVDGRLTFISSAGGFRYVVVRMAHLAMREQQIAIMAHELRHAVEIADAPDVVDLPSLLREYQRIGFVSGVPMPGMTFDSRAAVDTGMQVLKELMERQDD